MPENPTFTVHAVGTVTPPPDPQEPQEQEPVGGANNDSTPVETDKENE